MKFIMK